MKYCPECGRPNNNAARFCDNCGTDILEIVAAPDSQLNQVKDAQVPGKGPPGASRRFTRYLAGFVALIIVLGGGGLLFKYLTKVATPFDISGQYMEYLKAQDYEKAYKLINPELKLGQDIYIYSMKETDNQYGKIKDYRIEGKKDNMWQIMPEKPGASLYENIPVVIGRNEREPTTLVLTNISAGEKPEWRIDLSEQIRQADIQVPPVPNIEVKVCKKTLQLDQSGRSTITYLNEIPVPVEISAPEIASQSFDFPRDGGSTAITLQVSDNLQKQLEQVIDGFNKASIEAGLDSNMEHYAPYILRDSEKWIKLQDVCQKLALNDHHPQLTLKEVQYVRGYFTIDNNGKNKVLMDDTEIWEKQNVNTTASNMPVPVLENTVHWTYEFELQKDSNWKIINNYTRKTDSNN